MDIKEIQECHTAYWTAHFLLEELFCQRMRFLGILGCYSVITLLLPECRSSGNNVVTTKTGNVLGLKNAVGEKYVHSFLGIPYAVPPVGELRFKDSRPVEPWEGIYYATTVSAACTQLPFDPSKYKFISEDCLYLNIWVPENGKGYGSKAVMVWIHGGSFNGGSAMLDVYNGERLAATGDVIVASVNYRLGAFGFLYAGTEDAPGNMGLKDQVLAMRWIKDNIEAFGGDPSQITIFGQSAGSISISLHMVSPMTKGLFNRAILQSGTAYQPVFLNKTRLVDLSNQLSVILGCAKRDKSNMSDPSQVIKCLRHFPASNIASVERELYNPLQLSFLPMYGDEYLPRNPVQEIRAGNVSQIPIMIGNVPDEGSVFLGILNMTLLQIDHPVISMGEAVRYIETAFQQVSVPSTDVIIDYYLKKIPEKNKQLLVKRTHDPIGDWLLYCPSVFFAEIFASHGMTAYFYIFNHRRIISPLRAWLGVSHSEDYQFLFGSPLDQPSWKNIIDQVFSNTIMETWASFAKTGKPRYGSTEVEWPIYTKENPVALELNPCHPKLVNPCKKECSFWRQYLQQSNKALHDRYGA